MWPKRKAKNRRHERENVLEVRMRSRDARQWRVRMLTAAIGTLGGTAVMALLVWHAYQWALRRFVYQNQAYAVRRIEFRHDGRLRSDQVRRWTGVELGQNLLALDLEQIRHDLELNPWIERADVETIRPDRLRLGIREREPVAQVVVWRLDPADRRAWAETNYVDAQGVVLPPLRAEWVRPGEDLDFSHLPRLVGLDPTDVVPGEALRFRGVRQALDLIRAYESSTVYSRLDLEWIDVADPGALRGLVKQGTQLVFGREDYARQMRRWRSIQDYADSQGRSLDWLDLSVTNNVPARWREGTNPPPAAVPAKTKRTPRRHV
ncbi:MAG: FtsQ-type POTRA domain-containing protein [Verrucomicrobiales bacterium]|nr:FtsQ-type POTRA domain-containing protein [Verrucomicrobiales bacterium]